MQWCKSEIETKLYDLKSDKRKFLQIRNELERRLSEHRLRSKRPRFEANSNEIKELDQDLNFIDSEIARLENRLKRNNFQKLAMKNTSIVNK